MKKKEAARITKKIIPVWFKKKVKENGKKK